MAKFCSECGAKQAAEDAKFCHQCGFSLAPNEGKLNIEGDLRESTVMSAGRDIVTHISGEMVDCRVCGGSGNVEQALVCPDCCGSGIIKHDPPRRRGDRYLLAEGCLTCGGYGEDTRRRDRSDRQNHLRPGSGQVAKVSQCEACGGHGKVRI